MNDFQQYQQQLQMQRMMEMQQARMQQMQQTQQNGIMFGDQRALASSYLNPMGGTPMLGAGPGMATFGSGTTRQSLLGAAADAGMFTGVGIGTQGGLFNLGIGNRAGFRFADASRATTQARAQDQMAAFRSGFGQELGAALLPDFLQRKFGLAANQGLGDAAADMQDRFASVRGVNASGIEGRGVSRMFALGAMDRAGDRLSRSMPELNTEEIRKIQDLSMGTMSTAQLGASARSSSDFDKMMEAQEGLLKKIAENTKMSVDEIKETNKVFKGQGGTGGSLQVMKSVSDAVTGMRSTTGMTQEELLNMGAGFRAGARGMGMRNLNSVTRLMIGRTDATLRAFNNGEIDETSMAAFGGTTPGEQAAARAQVMMQRSRQFAVNNQTGIGLLGGQAGAIAASQGFAGQQMAVGAAIASDPINAAADAIYSKEGQARLDRNTVGAQQTAYQSAVAYQQQLPGANRSVAVQQFAQTMGLNPVQALTAFDRIEGLQDRINGLGDAGRALSPDIIDAIDKVAKATGYGDDRSAEVARLINEGKKPEDAIREVYTPRTRKEFMDIANKNPHIASMSANSSGIAMPGATAYTVDRHRKLRGDGEKAETDYEGSMVSHTYGASAYIPFSDEITVAQFLGPDTEYDTHRRTENYESFFGRRGNQDKYFKAAVPSINITNSAPEVLGSSGRPSHVIVTNTNDFAQTVGDE